MDSAILGPMLRAIDLTKTFERRGSHHLVLQGVSLQVEPTEIVTITGRSGAGKSTLLDLLGLRRSPDSGQVLFEGRDLHALRARERREVLRTRFASVGQTPRLIGDLNVLENIALPLLLDGGRTDKSYDRANRTLASLGLDGLEEALPGELSGGEAHRVELARALVVEPAVLFADEPTGDLDQDSGATVLECLGKAAESGVAVLLATHDERAAALGQRCLHLEGGKLRSATPTDQGTSINR